MYFSCSQLQCRDSYYLEHWQGPPITDIWYGLCVYERGGCFMFAEFNVLCITRYYWHGLQTMEFYCFSPSPLSGPSCKIFFAFLFSPSFSRKCKLPVIMHNIGSMASRFLVLRWLFLICTRQKANNEHAASPKFPANDDDTLS